MSGDILLGIQNAFSWWNLLYCMGGVAIGTFLGVLPGIGAIAAISMLLPLAFYIEPASAIILLAGVYYGAEYGGSTASILLNLPGTPSSAVATLDGYPMAKQGRAGVALFMTTIASFGGGAVGVVVIVFATPLIAKLALAFGPAEHFAIMLFGLIASGTASKGNPLNGIAMVLLGLLIGTIGVDMSSAVRRFTFGFFQLYDGVSIVALAMGLFGLSEVISSVGTMAGRVTSGVTLRSMLPTKGDLRLAGPAALRGAGVGTILGVLPGAGPTIASFMAYGVEKRISRDPSRFGRGAIEGLVAPEASNNAAAQTAFVPTFALGIPGTATVAIIMSAFLIHGITPGPQLMARNADLFWTIITSFVIGNVFLLVLNIPLIGVWVRVLSIPYTMLFPAVVCFICFGVYFVSMNVFDLWLLLAFGIFGYGMRLCGFEAAPLIIGFVLGPLVEENLRRALVLARGDVWDLFSRPISGSLLVCTVLLLIYTIFVEVRARGREREVSAQTKSSS